ncbi:MAG: metallophosphoesterase [Phycisphaerales bacterium]|nr:metallophosphoesterase [Phycisphaerales bacterium]
MVTVAIGDVHGCGYELQGLLAAVDRAHAGARLVFVGDLLTKGDHPHEVIRAIIDRRDAGQEIILVCGNHDLRLLAALVRVQSGVSPDQLPKHERQCWHILARHGMLRLAMRLMVEATETKELRDSAAGWTIVHAGIDPQLGLAETPDDVKIHIKALEGERHWWERYTGADGLIVVGHKPLSEPLVLCDAEGRPYVVNIDTGCVYGGFLTAYAIDADCLLSAPSMMRGPRTVNDVRDGVVTRSASLLGATPTASGDRDRRSGR